MALDRNDLELLRDMMREVSLEVTKESETRMMAYMSKRKLIPWLMVCLLPMSALTA